MIVTMCNCYSLSSIFLLCVKHHILHHFYQPVFQDTDYWEYCQKCAWETCKNMRKSETCEQWKLLTRERQQQGYPVPQSSRFLCSGTINVAPFWSFTFSGSSLCFPRCFFQGPSCGGEEVRVSGCCFWKARGAAAPLSPYLWLLLLLLLHHHSLIL